MTKEILFVHDDQESPAARRGRLEMAGFRVLTVQRADDCLAHIERRRPSLVLSDVLIHGANGFDLCRAIRERHAPGELPVILCSGLYEDERFHTEAERAGAQAYLVRPHDPHELLDHITTLTAT